MAPEKVVPYFGTLEKPECHILYNVTTMASTWHTVATKDVSLLRRQLDILGSLPKEYIFQNYLRCHDDIGWGLDYDFLKNFSIDEVSHKKFLNDFFTGKYPDTFGRGELYNDDPRLGDARLCGTTASLCGIEKYGFEGNVAGVDRSVRYDITLHAFMLSQSGIPVIYSGDEIGQVKTILIKMILTRQLIPAIFTEENSTGHLLQTEISQIQYRENFPRTGSSGTYQKFTQRF